MPITITGGATLSGFTYIPPTPPILSSVEYLVVAGGGGGGGSGWSGSINAGGAGGSGVIILRYPSAYTITIGAGLTGTTATVSTNKVTTITAGSGNVSWA